jgi:hypothetical protein
VKLCDPIFINLGEKLYGTAPHDAERFDRRAEAITDESAEKD